MKKTKQNKTKRKPSKRFSTPEFMQGGKDLRQKLFPRSQKLKGRIIGQEEKRTLRDRLAGAGVGEGVWGMRSHCLGPVATCRFLSRPATVFASLSSEGDSLWISVPASAASFLTCVDEAARGSFTKLLGLVGEGHFYHPRDVSRRRLHPDSVGSDEL